MEPALVPQHVSMAEAARIANRHGFVLRTVRHEGKLRIAMVRPGAAVPPGDEPPPAQDAASPREAR
jgi:hypothetical protein